MEKQGPQLWSAEDARWWWDLLDGASQANVKIGQSETDMEMEADPDLDDDGYAASQGYHE